MQVVYLPSCVTRMMGPSRGDPESESVHEKLLSLFGKANYEVIYPEVSVCMVHVLHAGAVQRASASHCSLTDLQPGLWHLICCSAPPRTDFVG